MREFVLHNLWKSQEFLLPPLFTIGGEPIHILATGAPNYGSGPDFFYSRIQIGDHLWSGHVEIHVRASDWNLHNHNLDVAYNSVILHVVWLADTEVRREDGTVIPTLQLSDFISEQELASTSYSRPSGVSKGLPCRSLLFKVPGELRKSWMSDLYRQRLREKSEEVIQWAEDSSHDWEQVLFRALLKGFGLNMNGQVFLSLSAALPFRVVRKIRSDLSALESLFFGLSGLLNKIRCKDEYTKNLIREYEYLRSKYDLCPEVCQQPLFFALRPGNFPTIRLSQLAVLYHRNPALFDRVRTSTSLSEIRSLLQTWASPYWENHFTFGKSCSIRKRKTTGHFTDLLILNAVIPLLYAFGQSRGRPSGMALKDWAITLKPEKNRITRMFEMEGVPACNALESQALIQLHNKFCQKNKCLHCRWGIYLLYGKY
jgi:hypothetical protein